MAQVDVLITTETEIGVRSRDVSAVQVELAPDSIQLHFNVHELVWRPRQRRLLIEREAEVGLE